MVDGQGQYYYEGGGLRGHRLPVQPEDSQVVAQFLGTKPTEDAAGKALPAPGTFTVAVENGSGLYDQGATTSAALEQLGFHVTSVTDTPAGATTTETTVLYSSPSELDDALRVQSALSGLAVLGYDPGLLTGGANANGTNANDRKRHRRHHRRGIGPSRLAGGRRCRRDRFELRRQRQLPADNADAGLLCFDDGAAVGGRRFGHHDHGPRSTGRQSQPVHAVRLDAQPGAMGSAVVYGHRRRGSLGGLGHRPQFRMFTARDITTATVTSDASD